MRNLLVTGSTLLAALWLVAPVRGMMIQIEASADINIVAATNGVVVCWKKVSGNCPGELFALDPTLQSVLWRQPETNWIYKATATDQFLYTFAGGVVRKRSLTTGALLWENPMRNIPKQLDEAPQLNVWERLLSPFIKTATYSTSLWSTPSQYQCEALIVAGSQLFVFRTALAGGGCVWTVCFSDWLCLDEVNGTLVTGRVGSYLGATDQHFLVGDYDHINLYRYGKTGVMDYQLIRLKDANSVTGGGYREDLRRSGNSCLFSTRRGTNDTVVAFFDKTKQLVVSAATNASQNMENCAVLDNNHFLRFGTQHRDTTPPSPPATWLELYNSQFVQITESKPLPREYQSEYYPPLIGFADGGRAIFQDGRRMLVVQMSSLDIIGNYDLGDVPSFHPDSCDGHRLYLNRGDKLVYDATGSGSAQQFSPESKPHVLRIRALDPATGRVVHSYDEPVTVHKIKVE